MLPIFDNGSGPHYKSEIVGDIGRFNVSAIMRRSLALKALETPLLPKDYELFENEARKISLSYELLKEENLMPSGSYSFEEINDKTNSWLLRCVSAQGMIGKIHTGSFYITDRFLEQIKEEPIKDYLLYLSWNQSHNIDSRKEAEALKSMWNFWANKVYEKFG